MITKLDRLARSVPDARAIADELTAREVKLGIGDEALDPERDHTAVWTCPPGGRLAVFWNVFQPPPEVTEAFSAVYRRVMPDSPIDWLGMAGPDSYSGVFTTAADAIRQAGALGDPEQWRFGWDRPYTRDEWLDQVPTFGGHSQVPPATLQELLTGIGAAIDALGGSFTMHYTAVVLTAARTGAA